MCNETGFAQPCWPSNRLTLIRSCYGWEAPLTVYLKLIHHWISLLIYADDNRSTGSYTTDEPDNALGPVPENLSVAEN